MKMNLWNHMSDFVRSTLERRYDDESLEGHRLTMLEPHQNAVIVSPTKVAVMTPLVFLTCLHFLVSQIWRNKNVQIKKKKKLKHNVVDMGISFQKQLSGLHWRSE